MFKLLRMNNYYFIVGGSAAWAEIVRILQEKKIPFTWMKSDTEGAVSVPFEKIDEVIAAGFVPVVIGAECGRSDVKVLKKYRHHVNASPLEIVSVWEHVPLATRWQELVLAHDEDCFNEFDYSTEIMRELCRRGFSRDEIDKVRALDREIRGITGAEEAAADECLQKHFTQNKGLLVVANLPHSRYRAVLDRVFWLQPMQNVLVLTTAGEFLYAGFADIAMDLQRNFRIQYLHYCWAEGHYADMAEQVRIIRYLVKASKIKKTDGII